MILIILLYIFLYISLSLINHIIIKTLVFYRNYAHAREAQKEWPLSLFERMFFRWCHHYGPTSPPLDQWYTESADYWLKTAS